MGHSSIQSRLTSMDIWCPEGIAMPWILLDDERPRVAKTLQTRGLTLVKRSEESSNLLEKRGEPGGNRTRKAKPKAET